ncbi:hypothetical protein GJ496_001419 [Pomphorhynchus laevis]|nr:hypothetical protein GJ496_001419 [Pomphorhynchus laevis]
MNYYKNKIGACQHSDLSLSDSKYKKQRLKPMNQERLLTFSIALNRPVRNIESLKLQNEQTSTKASSNGKQRYQGKLCTSQKISKLSVQSALKSNLHSISNKRSRVQNKYRSNGFENTKIITPVDYSSRSLRTAINPALKLDHYVASINPKPLIKPKTLFFLRQRIRHMNRSLHFRHLTLRQLQFGIPSNEWPKPVHKIVQIANSPKISEIRRSKSKYKGTKYDQQLDKNEPIEDDDRTSADAQSSFSQFDEIDPIRSFGKFYRDVPTTSQDSINKRDGSSSDSRLQKSQTVSNIEKQFNDTDYLNSPQSENREWSDSVNKKTKGSKQTLVASLPDLRLNNSLRAHRTLKYEDKSMYHSHDYTLESNKNSKTLNKHEIGKTRNLSDDKIISFVNIEQMKTQSSDVADIPNNKYETTNECSSLIFDSHDFPETDHCDDVNKSDDFASSIECQINVDNIDILPDDMTNSDQSTYRNIIDGNKTDFTQSQLLVNLSKINKAVSTEHESPTAQKRPSSLKKSDIKPLNPSVCPCVREIRPSIKITSEDYNIAEQCPVVVESEINLGTSKEEELKDTSTFESSSEALKTFKSSKTNQIMFGKLNSIANIDKQACNSESLPDNDDQKVQEVENNISTCKSSCSLDISKSNESSTHSIECACSSDINSLEKANSQNLLIPDSSLCKCGSSDLFTSSSSKECLCSGDTSSTPVKINQHLHSPVSNCECNSIDLLKLSNDSIHTINCDCISDISLLQNQNLFIDKVSSCECGSDSISSDICEHDSQLSDNVNSLNGLDKHFTTIKLTNLKGDVSTQTDKQPSCSRFDAASSICIKTDTDSKVIGRDYQLQTFKTKGAKSVDCCMSREGFCPCCKEESITFSKPKEKMSEPASLRNLTPNRCLDLICNYLCENREIECKDCSLFNDLYAMLHDEPKILSKSKSEPRSDVDTVKPERQKKKSVKIKEAACIKLVESVPIPCDSCTLALPKCAKEALMVDFRQFQIVSIKEWPITNSASDQIEGLPKECLDLCLEEAHGVSVRKNDLMVCFSTELSRYCCPNTCFESNQCVVNEQTSIHKYRDDGHVTSLVYEKTKSIKCPSTIDNEAEPILQHESALSQPKATWKLDALLKNYSLYSDKSANATFKNQKCLVNPPLFMDLPVNNYDHNKAYNLGIIKYSKYKTYFEEYGSPNGIPVVVITDCPTNHATSFKQFCCADPDFFRIIMYHQLGHGLSRPKDVELHNPTELTCQLEELRSFLQINQWMLLASGFGCVLALFYRRMFACRVLLTLLTGLPNIEREVRKPLTLNPSDETKQLQSDQDIRKSESQFNESKDDQLRSIEYMQIWNCSIDSLNEILKQKWLSYLRSRKLLLCSSIWDDNETLSEDIQQDLILCYSNLFRNRFFLNDRWLNNMFNGDLDSVVTLIQPIIEDEVEHDLDYISKLIEMPKLEIILVKGTKHSKLKTLVQIYRLQFMEQTKLKLRRQ